MILRSLWVILRWTLLIGALLVVSLIATLSMVVSTQPGTRWVLSQVQRFVPLELGEVRGNLLTGLDLAYFDYRQEEGGELQQRYRGEQVSFRWQPLALFYNAVSVQSLTARHILVQIPAADENAEPTPMAWPVLALPVRIELGEVDVSHIRVSQTLPGIEAVPLVTIDRVSGSVSLGTFNLRLADVVVDTPDYSVIASGRLGLRYPYDADLAVQWQYQLSPASDEGPEGLLLGGKAQIGGDVTALTLEHQLTAPLQVESSGRLIPNLSPPPGAITPLADPQLELVNDIASQPLLAQWFPADTAIPVVGGRLQVSGWISDYQAALQATAQWGEYPEVHITADTRGDLESIALTSVGLSAVAPSGKSMQLSASGRLQWTPALDWDLQLQGEGLDPAVYARDWPGDMTLQLHSRGSLQDEALQLQVDALALGGQLRGREVGASGSVSWRNQVLQADQLLVSMGANHIRLDGQVSDSPDMRWQLEAPFLSQLDSALSGAISSRGEVSGKLENPDLQLSLAANGVRWQDYSLDKLELQARSPSRDHYDLQLQAHDLLAAGTAVRDLSLAVTGSVAEHQIALELLADQWGELGLGLASGYQDQQWQGRFTRLDLHYPDLPRWWLLSSETSRASAEQAQLGQLCLTTRTWLPRPRRPDTSGDIVIEQPEEEAADSASATPPALCVDGSWASASGAVLNASLRDIPLRMLRSYLKPEVDIAGVVDGDIRARMDAGGRLSADASLQTREGELQMSFEDSEPERYPWQTAAVTARLENNRLKADADILWTPWGELAAGVDLNLDSRQLAGELTATFNDLSPFAALLPMVDNLRGRLVSDLQLSGAVDKPQLTGQLTLIEGGATLTRLGLDIAAVGFTLDSHADGRVSLRGKASSGEGEVRLNGEFDGLGKTNWQATASLQGEDFQVLEQAQIKARVSPDIQLSVTPHELRLTGQTAIPYARINIKTLPPSATNVSADVVVEDENSEGLEVPIPMAVFMNLLIEVGPDVIFDGFGLTSGLTGKMELIKTPERPMLASGFVGVTDGKYKAYGQELTISRGRLLFQGPLDNPALEIRAQRVLKGTNDHIVGLQIGGSLQKPTSSVYSDPPVATDGEAMALLLTGKPLSEATAGDAYAIIAAMSGIGMDGDGSFTGQIAQTLHLDELSINADDGFEHSSLWMGKYLTPRLFVRYVVGLFDQTSRIGMRYQMTERLRLEAESGDIQSVDMIYKIER